MKTPQRQLFLEAVTALFQAHQSIGDLFFKNRVGEEIQRLLDSYIKYHTSSNAPGQHKETRGNHVKACKDMAGTLEAIIYVKAGIPLALATAQEHVLYYLRSIILDPKKSEDVVLATPALPVPVIPIPTQKVVPASKPSKEDK